MTIPLTDFDRVRLEEDLRLFSDEIESDPWIMYHGTSGFNAESIECEGFQWSDKKGLRKEIEGIVNIFEKMRWCGLDRSSLAVLKPFSLQHDFAGTDASPIYFAETSKRALMYATRDFAGGEKLRAIRRSLDHLQQYLHSPDIRKEHRDLMQYEYD